MAGAGGKGKVGDCACAVGKLELEKLETTEPGLELMWNGAGTERRLVGMSDLLLWLVIEDLGRVLVVDLGLRESVLLGGLGGFFLDVGTLIG